MIWHILKTITKNWDMGDEYLTLNFKSANYYILAKNY